MRKNENVNLLALQHGEKRRELQGMQRIHFVGSCACRGALEVKLFLPAESCVKHGQLWALTSSLPLLDVESAVCTAQLSARDELSGRRVGKWNK